MGPDESPDLLVGSQQVGSLMGPQMLLGMMMLHHWMME
jgi:hypothetical protein